MSIQKPDLASVFCSELRIYGHTTLGEDYLDKIPELGAKGKKGKGETIIASSAYTVKKRKHTCVIVFGFSKKRSKRRVSLNFRMIIETRKFTIRLKGRKQLDAFEVIEHVVKMGVEVRLYFMAYFEYPTQRFESVISLPYDTPVPPLERVEVAGLRINVKKSPDEEYSQIVDIEKKDNTVHMISFEKRAHALNESFMADLLAEASRYSKRLIKKRIIPKRLMSFFT